MIRLLLSQSLRRNIISDGQLGERVGLNLDSGPSLILHRFYCYSPGRNLGRPSEAPPAFIYDIYDL